MLFIATTISILFGMCTSWCDSGPLVINEIMYDPRNGEPEWIEIYNGRVESIDLLGWTIEDADSTRSRRLTDHSIIIISGGYACIAEDSSALRASIPSVICPALQPLNSWPRLNNNGDRIVLRDSSGVVIDMVEYNAQWGGGDGKSLERIHPDWPSQSPHTWSTCVSPVLATPCAPNSIYAPSLLQKAVVTVEPDPFDTRTTISFKLTVPTAIIKLEIFDIRGRLVGRLFNKECGGTSGFVLGNGRDNKGEKLRMGVYILYFEAINAEMGVLERIKKSITLAAKLD